ncbi:MAG: hypothetical protein ABIL09_25370 [Gemmatimonadota bacterium]
MRPSLALLLPALLALPHPGRAATGYAGEFLAVGAGARGLALGSAYVAMAEDATAGYWNSAGLAQPAESQAHFMHAERFEGLVDQDFLALSFRGPWFDGMALGLLRVGVDDIQLTTLQDPGSPIGPDNRPVVASTASSADYALYLSGARQLGERLDLGVSFKTIYRTIDTHTAYGFGADLGVRYELRPGVVLGANLRDLTSTPIFWDTDATDRIMPSLALGLALSRQVGGGRVTLALGSRAGGDAEDAGHPQPVLGGLEYEVGMVALRAGIDETRQSFGIGLRPLPKLRLDVAYLQHDELEATYLVSAIVGL